MTTLGSAAIARAVLQSAILLSILFILSVERHSFWLVLDDDSGQHGIIVTLRKHHVDGAIEGSNGAGNHSEVVAWKDGCIEWMPPPKRDAVSGLVVTLMLGDDMRSYVMKMCHHFVPSQLSHFLEPHGLDMLLVIPNGRTHYQRIVRCLKLSPLEGQETFTNLDGTTMTTYRHRTPSNRTTVYFAPDYVVSLPTYIQADPSLMDPKQFYRPDRCSAASSYVSGTRWYSNEMLHLGILGNYDYWVKLDLDIIFVKPISMHLLQDLNRKGAVFAHTAEYTRDGSPLCAWGSRRAVDDFATTNSTATGPWKRELCTSHGVQQLQHDSDMYYTNFVMGSVPFWQSPLILEFARYMSEYQPGFFVYRWTDQIFFHNAMGLVLENFTSRVLDYTDLRCAPQANCWMSTQDTAKFGFDAYLQCKNDGAFVHSKKPGPWAEKWQETVVHDLVVDQTASALYDHTYKHNCSYKKRGG